MLHLAINIPGETRLAAAGAEPPNPLQMDHAIRRIQNAFMHQF